MCIRREIEPEGKRECSCAGAQYLRSHRFDSCSFRTAWGLTSVRRKGPFVFFLLLTLTCSNRSAVMQLGRAAGGMRRLDEITRISPREEAASTRVAFSQLDGQSPPARSIDAAFSPYQACMVCRRLELEPNERTFNPPASRSRRSTHARTLKHYAAFLAGSTQLRTGQQIA